MLTPRANIHHHKLPRPGAIVRLEGLQRNGHNPRNRWIVESYPLSDAADQRYSRGIHTVNLRGITYPKLRIRVSGFYCIED